MAGELPFKVIPLNGDNYSSWSLDVKMLLMDRGAWDIVSGTEKLPMDKDEDIRDFKRRSDKGLSTIYACTAPRYRILLQKAKTGTEAWDILKKYFEPDSRARVMKLTRDFFDCRMGPDEDIGLFAGRLENIADSLQDAGQPVPELYKVMQLTSYLPPEFESIVQSIYRYPDEQFTFLKAHAELLAEEARLLQRAVSGTSHSYFVRGKNIGTSRTPSPDQRKSKKKFVHLQKDSAKKAPKRQISHLLEAMTTDARPEPWILDSATTHHFCNNRKLFKDFSYVANENLVGAIKGVTTPIKGKGTVQILLNNRSYTLKNVLFAPDLRKNLISLPKIDSEGLEFKGGGGKIDIISDKKIVFRAELVDKLYYVFPDKNVNVRDSRKGKESNQKSKKNEPDHLALNADSVEVWHRKLAHINLDDIKNTFKNNCVSGLPRIPNEKITCTPCREAKGRRISFKKLDNIRSKNPLELLHLDVCGPLPTASINRQKYFFSIVDDFSRKVYVFPLKTKDEVFDTFVKFQKRVERFLDRKIKAIRSDNGSEFDNEQFKIFCSETGIRHEKTNVYTPEQNGVVERFNYTAVNGIKVLLRDSGLNQSFWAEALLHFTYTWNRLCHGGRTKTPFQLFGGKQPSVKHIKAFGTKAFVGVPKQKRRKFDLRAKEGVLVGYAQQTKGYRIYLPVERKIIETINVRFEESPISSGNGNRRDTEEPVLDPEYLVFRIPLDDSDQSHFKKPEQSVDSDGGESAKINDTECASESSSDISDRSFYRQTAPHTKCINWERKAVTRPDKSRTDIYYYPAGKSKRLRSQHDIQKYCDINKIKYQPNLFDFSGKNKFVGIVSGDQTPSSSLISD